MAACLTVAAPCPVVAADSEPERAGREGRAALDRLLTKQRRDREVEAAQPKPAAPKLRRDSAPAGKTLPAICIGCGAR